MLLVAERHEDADGRQTQSAGADDDDGTVRLDVGKFSYRRIGRDAGAGIGRSQRRIDVAEVDQMLRLVDQHMGAVAAIAKHPEASRGQAHLVVAGNAMLAFSAAGPRVHQPMVADGDALCLRPERHHLADGLVAGNEGQRDAAVLERQPLAAAEIVVTVLKIEIAVADAAISGLEKNLSAGRFGGRHLDRLQRRSIPDHGPATHYFFLPKCLNDQSRPNLSGQVAAHP